MAIVEGPLQIYEESIPKLSSLRLPCANYDGIPGAVRGIRKWRQFDIFSGSMKQLIASSLEVPLMAPFFKRELHVAAQGLVGKCNRLPGGTWAPTAILLTGFPFSLFHGRNRGRRLLIPRNA